MHLTIDGAELVEGEAVSDEGDVAYLPSLQAQEAAYWEARRQGMGLDDKHIGDLLRAAAPHIRAEHRKPFRLFELTMLVYLPDGAELPVTFRDWLEWATGVSMEDGPATPTRLVRIIEHRYPLADDVIEKRTDGRGPWS